jgi:hypothetical protein
MIAMGEADSCAEETMPGWMSNLFKSFKPVDPLDTPCACGQPARVRLTNARESRFTEGKTFCLDCVRAVLHDGLRVAAGKWLVVQPVPGPACYVPYTLEEIADFRDLPDWASQIEELLHSAGPKCEVCSAPADQFLWLPTASQEAQPWKLPDFFRASKACYRCPKCLEDALLQSLRERNLTILEMVLPKAGPGAWFSWAY